MMKNISLFFLLATVAGCHKTQPEKKNTEKLTIQFIPFLNPDDCTVVIEMGKDSAEMDYKVSTPPNPTTGQRKGSEGFDSLKIKIGGSPYLKFAEKVRSMHFKSDFCPTKLWEPGISFLDPSDIRIDYIDHLLDTSAYDFSNPTRLDCPLLFRLLDAFFELADSVMRDRKRVVYRETLKNRFDFGFRIKKLSGFPLEYGFFGYYQNKDKLRLLDFLDSLPSDNGVIINVDHAFAWGDRIDPILDGLKSKKHIYWLDVDVESESNFLKRLGIRRKAYKSREAILRSNSNY